MKLTIVLLALLAMYGCEYGATNPSTSPGPKTVGTVKPDNTAVNARDRQEPATTPIDQNENKADVNMTADIRKQIVAAKLSVDAQNVKVITQDGHVTLRGPVKTDSEKERIEEIATQVAGAENVESELEVESER